MKKFVSAVFTALLSSTASAWLSSNSGSYPYSWITFEWAYNVPLTYETTYYSGIGPYYSPNIFKAIDKTMHYEEYGGLFSFLAKGSWGIVLGDITTKSDYYYWNGNAEVDILNSTAYKQVTWFQRPVSNLVANGVSAMHAWVGGAYQVATGQAYLSYNENSYTGTGNLWASGTWTARPAYTDTTFLETWKDPTYTVNVINYLPTAFQTYITEYQLYETQLF